MPTRKKPRQTGVTRRATPRRYAPAEPAIQKMLTAAEQVLIRDGYHALSTRRVAAEAGVSPGHLSYYFPTKNELLRAMITIVMDRYAAQIHDVRGGTTGSTRGDPRDFVRWLMQDTVTEHTSGLFRELWVLAKHDPAIAQEVLRFYEAVMESFVENLALHYPDADRRRLQRLAHLVGMLSEGATVLFAGPGQRSVTFEEMVQVVCDVVSGELASITCSSSRGSAASPGGRPRRRR